MLTAHDFPSGHVAEAAGMEMVLVGDSLAMVALGMADTSEICLDEMILHCRSVSRAVHTAFTVCHIAPSNTIGLSQNLISLFSSRLETCQWVPTKYLQNKP